MKSRAILSLLLCVAVLAVVCAALIRPPAVPADGTPVTTVTTAAPTTAVPTTTTTTAAPTPPQAATSPRIGLYAADTLSAVYELDASVHLYPASLTKLVTAYTALQFMNAGEECVVGSELSLVRQGSSLCRIQQGYRMTLRELLAGLLMASGNDAAYTIAANVARKVGGAQLSDREAVTYFCELMNRTAKQLGMQDSHFVNPEGWDDPEQYTTVRDLARITQKASQNVELRAILRCTNKTIKIDSGQTLQFTNTCLMMHAGNVYYDARVTGAKTGSTSKAGKCLIVTLTEGERAYIAIVTGCKNEDDRYRTMQSLIKRIP